MLGDLSVENNARRARSATTTHAMSNVSLKILFYLLHVVVTISFPKRTIDASIHTSSPKWARTLSLPRGEVAFAW